MNNLRRASSDGISDRPAKRACLRKSSPNPSEDTEVTCNEVEYASDEPCEGMDDADPKDTDVKDYFASEATRYIEGLVRGHLESVMENHRKANNPSLKRFTEASPQLALVSLSAACFEHDVDIVLAGLLETVINIHRTAEGGLARATDDFLQKTVNIMLSRQPSSRDFIAFLQTVIEQLIRREVDDDKPSSLKHTSDSTTLSTITVSVSDSTEEIALEDILSYFWSFKLETGCDHCHQPFKDEPPIRTIAQESTQTSSRTLHVRVFNRHFDCLKDNETFMVPVSHVWDNSIRVANESKAHNDEAASTMIGTLKCLFENAGDAYGQNVEFWHDYFSVPQWEPMTKESLLLRLPTIFRSADEILIHMSDLSPGSVVQYVRSHTFREGISMKQSIQRIPLMIDLWKSQWMQRMWVTLEYSQAKAACVMDQSNKIWRNAKSANSPFARNTFTKLLMDWETQLILMFQWARTFSYTIHRPHYFLSSLMTRQNMQERPLCLGKVMELISTKQCQVFRDRFFAMHIILNPNPTASDPHPILGTDVDACSWVWRSALSRGDYSPLLLQPRECVYLSDPKPPLPSWLVGCRSVDGAEWDHGNQETAPRESPLVTEVSVKTVLTQVGEIRAIHYLNTEHAGEVEGVNQLVQILVAIANNEGLVLSPTGLYDAIDYIFPFDRMHTGVTREKLNIVFTFNERQAQDSEFSTKLSEHLGVFTEVPDEGSKAQTLDAAQSITTLLQLDTHIMGTMSADITRLTRSRHISRHRKARGAINGEPLCEVRCPKCHKTTLLRLDLRESGQVGDIVYRIPGLSYFESVDEGVGLVLRDSRITGRMFYGKPACKCELRETIEIF